MTDPNDPQTPFEVPRDTTPTWEVELLLSGALVFAMLQAPGVLNEAFYWVQPRLDGSLHFGAIMIYLYLKISCYALIITFVLHLASRAIWVAALGLRSVYPEGILWDKLKRGRIFRDYAQATVPTLDETINQADNRASKVFALGLLLALMALSIMLFTLALGLVGALIGWLLRDPTLNVWLNLALIALVVIPMTLVSFVDRRMGERIQRGGRTERVIRAVYSFGGWMMWGRLTNPILLTVFSRVGVGRGNLMLLGSLYTLIAIILAELMLRAGVIDLPGRQLLPESAPGYEMRGAWYADQRTQEEALQGNPFIASVLVTGPYLRLFVPYMPRRSEATIREDCPQAVVEIDHSPSEDARKAAEAARTEALLACMASPRLHPLLLDGQPIEFRYDLGEDPVSGLPGFVAMLPVQSLAAGRHVLSVGRPPREDKEKPQDPVVIPFWR